MPKFMMERHIANAGELTRQQLDQISHSSCTAVAHEQVEIEWMSTIVTSDRMYCVYTAPDEQTLSASAERSGFPATSIATIKQMASASYEEFD